MYRSSNGINGNFPIYINVISGKINYFYQNMNFENHATSTISLLNNLHISLIDPDTSDIFDINDNKWFCLEIELLKKIFPYNI
jgi:hypothetical protein